MQLASGNIRHVLIRIVSTALIITSSYRSVWDGSRNKPTECQRGLLEPVTLSVEMQRNLSTHWFHGIPSISVDARLEPLQVGTYMYDAASLDVYTSLSNHYVL